MTKKTIEEMYIKLNDGSIYDGTFTKEELLEWAYYMDRNGTPSTIEIV